MEPGNLYLDSVWFDGRSPRAHAVRLLVNRGELLVQAVSGEFEHRHSLSAVRWPEHRRYGGRQAELPDGSLIQHHDAPQWDAWWHAQGMKRGRVDSWMQSWRASAVALLGAVAFVAAAWLWGVPVLSTVLVQLVPASLEERIGRESYEQLAQLFLEPSELSEEQQVAVRRRFENAVQASYPAGDAPPWTLSFHGSELLGANAFALPGGTIVMTDDLVEMLEDRPDAVTGVLAHELGHVQHRDGLDMLVRASLVSALVGVVLGDASGFLAAVPATLMTQSYSRDVERAADAHAAWMLHSAGISPAEMAVFFERIRQEERKQLSGPGGEDGTSEEAGEEKKAGAAAEEESEEETTLPIAISSHPDHEERIRYFREWAPAAASR